MNSPWPHPVYAHARARPRHIALAQEGAQPGQGLSYAALAEACTAWGAHYQARGLRPGDRVALAGPHNVAWAVQLHALNAQGACVLPLDGQAPEPALVHALAAAKVEHVVALPGTAPAVVRATQSVLGRAPWWTEAPAQDAASSPAQPWQLDRDYVAVQTSGTTGSPTLVALNGQALMLHSLASATRLGHHIDDVWLNVLPLHHVGGLMMLYRALWFGATVVLPASFDAAQVAGSLVAGHCTLASLVPTMLERVLQAMPPQASCHPRVRAILVGGARTPQALFDAALARGLPVSLTWGMTEAASQVCTRWPGTPGPVGQVGSPLPFFELALNPDQQLVIMGPIVHTKLVTRDVGAIDAEGEVTLHGRRDRTLISGGKNIAPEEVESLLLEHPGVADAAVVGRADTHWGERPVAHLVAAGEVPQDGTLDQFCRARLAAYKVPVQFFWHPKLPRSPLGKLQVSALTDSGTKDPP